MSMLFFIAFIVGINPDFPTKAVKTRLGLQNSVKLLRAFSP